MFPVATTFTDRNVADEPNVDGDWAPDQATDAQFAWAARQSLDADGHGWRTELVSGVGAVATTVFEAALEAELIEHLGYPKYDQAGRLRGSNSRNGTRTKTVATWLGLITVDVPRDRWGTFQPLAVGKWQRRATGLDQLVFPLAARGAPSQVTAELLSGVYRGADRRGLRIDIAATVRERMQLWHQRPLPAAYPMLVFNRVVVRSAHYAMCSRPVHTVLGVDREGRRDLLGLWIGTNKTTVERWCEIGVELKARGIGQVDGLVCDPIPALAMDLQSIWPGLVVRHRGSAPGLPVAFAARAVSSSDQRT